jgi:hypothetical protein
MMIVIDSFAIGCTPLFFGLHRPIRDGEIAPEHRAIFHHMGNAANVLKQVNVAQRISIEDDNVRELANIQGAYFVSHVQHQLPCGALATMACTPSCHQPSEGVIRFSP